ncbi:4Fe-4S binding protein, partial [Mycobacterium tuberculosis]|nr:4Fe-4S binding protein [Mycobacterium tuberculosis]
RRVGPGGRTGARVKPGAAGARGQAAGRSGAGPTSADGRAGASLDPLRSRHTPDPIEGSRRMIAHIFEERCDGCNSCVAACPTHV